MKQGEEASVAAEGSDDDIVLTIHQTSQLLRVPAPTIRSWERRYAIPPAQRRSGTHRRYTPDQIEMLRRLRDHIAKGHRAREAAAMVHAASTSSPAMLVQAFLDAAQHLEPGRIEQVLDTAQLIFGLEGAVDHVLLPALHQIGLDWEAGRCQVAHEHLTTEVTRSWLTGVSGSRETSPRARSVVLACGPSDEHTLGLQALAALLTQRDWDCRILGARTPAESLALAVQEVKPAAVVVVSHLPAARRHAVEALRASPQHRSLLYYAGNAFRSHQARHGVPGTYLGAKMSAAADLVNAGTRNDS